MEDAMNLSENSVLRLISIDMKVQGVSGEETFIRSKEFFYFTPSFVNNYSRGATESTEETKVHGFMLLRNATFREMFEEISKNLDSLAFTENQIVDFIRNNRKWMNRGAVTYFLFKYRNHTVVAAIFPKPDETSFGLDVYDVNDPTRWYHLLGAYVVVPSGNN